MRYERSGSTVCPLNTPSKRPSSGRGNHDGQYTGALILFASCCQPAFHSFGQVGGAASTGDAVVLEVPPLHPAASKSTPAAAPTPGHAAEIIAGYTFAGPMLPLGALVEDDVPEISQHADSNHSASSNGHSPNTDDDFATDVEDDEGDVNGNRADEGPVHRPLIRASLPRPEGQQPPARPIPEFTIRQPAGRPGSRFRPRHQRGGQQGQQFGGNRGNGNFAGGPPRGMRSGSGGRPPVGGGRHQGGSNRKRSR